MNFIVDPLAPPDWDRRSFSTFICILSVSIVGGIFWFFRMYGKHQIYGRFMADDLLMALAEGLVEFEDFGLLPLAEIIYATVAAISTYCDFICFLLPFLFIKMRHLIHERKQLQYGWMFITFMTTGISICRGFAIKPATSEYSTEARDLVILGVLELNMGVITTSVPACQIWMVAEPLDKLRYTWPLRHLWALYLRSRPLRDFLIRNTRDPATFLHSVFEEARQSRHYARLMSLPFYSNLFKAKGTVPTQRDLGQHSKLNLMKLRLREWCLSEFKQLHRSIQGLLGIEPKEDQLFDIELRDIDANQSNMPQSQQFLETACDEPELWIDEEDLSSEDPLLPEKIDEYISNRNYNILFPSTETVIQTRFEEALANHEYAELENIERIANRRLYDINGSRKTKRSTVLWGIRTWKDKARTLARVINT
ncbi:hypothetical protein Dda_8371 [Drechslerella dactyloides]|uniref:Uncharacterized protein n=1 Tax=Drechslerella dactyloides TaxID=74499 RepID=A0AAD6NFS0_DREDA|nr:hypothetical protein Dda_8371 [Drechslerella dactyloides]